MRTVKIPSTKINEYFLKIDDYKGGTNTLINQSRLPNKFAVETINLFQDQDGIWRTRPGLNYYGEAISAASTIDGAYQYEKTDGTRETIAVAGGKVWKSTDGGAWTEVTGATFTVGEKPFFLHTNNILYIANGTDPLAYYDGTDLTTYSQISAPSAPSGSLTTLTAGSYNNYYRIVAVNSVGFTTPSASTNVTTNKDRSQWTSTEKVALSWSAVVGATGYQVFWGQYDGEEYWIADTQTNSLNDMGETTMPKNLYIETPDDNTTGAPKFRSMEISGNRMWATYDPDNKYRVYGSGTGQYFGYFSSFYGGFYVDLEKGGINKPISVVHYRTGKGDPAITTLCSSPDGKGTIFQIDLTTVTVGDVTFTVPSTYKIVGSIGASSPYGVVKSGDNVFFLNEMGIYALRNKQQIFNVLSTDDNTGPIRNKWEGLNKSNVSNYCAYHKAPRIYFSVSEGSENDATIIFDLERNNLNYKWNVGFNQFFEYTDNSSTKITHFLAVPTSGNKLVEISDNYDTDFGSAFYQSYISPLIPIHKDYTLRAKIREVIYELGRLRGTYTLEVLGLTANKQVSTLGTKTITASTGTSGIGDDLFSEFLFSDTNDTPSTYAELTSKKTIKKIRDKLYAIQFKITSSTAGSYVELLGIQAKGTLQPARPPSQWN